MSEKEKTTNLNRLANAQWVEFLMSDSTACTYSMSGIILRFVQGYTPSQIKKIQEARRKKSYIYEILEDRRRFLRGVAPLRKVDCKKYALVLIFDSTADDYLLRWVEVAELSPKNYNDMDSPRAVLVPREGGVIRHCAPGIRVGPL